MDIRLENQNQFRQQQEKYVYYVLALSVASIAFTLNQTTGQALSYFKIPAGIAIICWTVSVFLGLKFLRFTISNLFANDKYIEIKKGEAPEVGSNQNMQLFAEKTLEDIMNKNGESANRFFKWQQRLFISGMILFIIWHVLEMYTNTI
jgi:hypothetical protein